MIRVMIFSAAAAAFGAAQAGEIVIPLPDGTEIHRSTVTYSCEGEDYAVEYINAGEIALAIIEVEGEPMVGAITVSASGARYQAGRYVWWTKGHSAFLADVMAGEDAEPLAECEGEMP